METKYKKASKSLARTFFYLHSGEEKKIRMDTVEHTASTILVVLQTVTKN